jgi:outer membrane protein assembly factor BamB
MEVVDMLRFRFLVLTVSCVLIFAALVSAEDDPAPARPVNTPPGLDSTYAEASSRWLIPRSRVEQTDLKIVWQFNLAMSGPEELDELIIADNRLCALSNSNFLTCLNRADGNVMFSSFIATTGLPLTGLTPYKGELITIVGDNLVEISVESGVEKTPTNITGGITCPVVRNDSFFYIAGSDGRIHALRAKDKVQAFEVAAENGSLITSVLADQDVVVFATKAGNVVCTEAYKAKKIWQFDAPAAIAGAVVRDADSLYFACRDTCVYCLELSSGHLIWKYQTQAILDASPQPGKKVVYQRIPDVGLVALDKQAGKLIWQVPDGAGLLAESGDKAFVITKAGLLAAMDNIKAKQLYSIDVGRPVKYATNTADSRIYIGDAKGRLACLQPK